MLRKTSALCLTVMLAMALPLAGCSRQQSDWQKTRETNTADAYEQFLKKYPSGEFTAQAQARVKELYEERDWQKARDADTPEAYQAFLKQYPEGKWTEEARIRVENFTLAQASGSAPSSPSTASDSGAPSADASTSAPVPSGTATARPIPVTPPASPTPATTAAATPTPKPAVKAAAAPAGSYGIQLGAYKSGAAAAHERWTDLLSQYPTLLSGLSSKVSAKDTADGKLYRLQSFGLTEKHARDICRTLTAKSQACVVLPPG
jgi:cell division protein FtsN